MVRGINILRFLGSITGEERNDLNLKIICLLPLTVNNTSSIAFQAKMDKNEIKEASVRCKLLLTKHHTSFPLGRSRPVYEKPRCVKSL